MELLAREMVTTPSSRGWRSTSRVERLNSGSSSRKRTPWWARLTSPGRGVVPPPMSPASEMVWCGARKGRWRQQPLARLQQPHDAVNLGGLQGLFQVQGRQDGRQPLGQHGLAGARRADHQDVVAAGRGQQQGPFHRLLALDLPEIQVIVRRQVAGFFGAASVRAQGLAAGQELHQLGEVIGGINFDALDHRGLPGVVPGDDQGQAGLRGWPGPWRGCPGWASGGRPGTAPRR